MKGKTVTLMKRLVLAAVVVNVLAISALLADEPTVAEVTHRQFQAVDEYGEPNYSATDKVVLTGIVLNNPEYMLNPTPSSIGMGGEWQIFIQGEGSDHAGTALWLGQNYSITPFGSEDYNDVDFAEELSRINRDKNDPNKIINAGDRIKVTGFYKSVWGKMNINEQHQINALFDFQIEVLKPAVGLPTPEVITLDQVKDGTNFIFDPNRNYGCEFYQGCLVRVDDVNIVDPQNWGEKGTIIIRDSNGLEFPVKLCVGDGFSKYSCPTGQIDVIGIFNQEDKDDNQYKSGYEIWVVNYDGNGFVLTDRGYKRGNLTGDVNIDYKVDFLDFVEFAENWLQTRAGLYNDGI